MDGRRQPPIADAVAVAAVAAVCAGVVLQLLLPPEWAPEPPVTPDYPAGLAFPVLGAVITRRRPGLVLGPLMCAGGLLVGVAVLGQSVLLQLAAAGALPAAGVVGWVSVVGWALGGGLLAVVLPLYTPTGRLPSPRWRPVVAAGLVLATAQAVNGLVRPESLFAGAALPARIPNLLQIPGYTAHPAVSDLLQWLVNACVSAALASLVIRLRGAGPVARRQIGWPLAAYAVYVLFLLLGDGVVLVTTLCAGMVPVAITFAVLRHRLFDLDTVISRTLLAAGLLTAVAGVYFGTGALASLLVTGYHEVAGLVTALLAGLLFQPSRRALQRLIDRALYGQVGDPVLLARRLTDEIRSADPAQALAVLVSVMRDGLAVQGVAVHVPEGLPVRVESGDPGAGARVVPLNWHGEPMGELVIGRPGPRRFPAAHDERVIDALVPYAADVAHAARMAADLQRSRERVLTAREEERRRLRRDLHDGLGQQLSGLAMTLTLARAGLRESAKEADRLLDGLREGVAAVHDDLQRLVDGLRPPTLDDLGLAAAVGVLAGGDPTVTVTVHGELDELPAAVEVAAYRIAQEALTNARKHADARSIRIHLARDGDLRLTVTDDGRGLAPAREAGVGLRSMRERAAELGGSLVITSGDEGTSVEASLPTGGDGPRARHST